MHGRCGIVDDRRAAVRSSSPSRASCSSSGILAVRSSLEPLLAWISAPAKCTIQGRPLAVLDAAEQDAPKPPLRTTSSQTRSSEVRRRRDRAQPGEPVAVRDAPRAGCADARARRARARAAAARTPAQRASPSRREPRRRRAGARRTPRQRRHGSAQPAATRRRRLDASPAPRAVLRRPRRACGPRRRAQLRGASSRERGARARERMPSSGGHGAAARRSRELQVLRHRFRAVGRRAACDRCA